MMIMLTDDAVIEIFDSPLSPPRWIEAIDIENEEYQFCDDRGQKYVGEITRPAGLFRQAEWKLRPEGTVDVQHVLSLIAKAEKLEPNDRFPNLKALREHCIGVARAMP